MNNCLMVALSFSGKGNFMVAVLERWKASRELLKVCQTSLTMQLLSK